MDRLNVANHPVLKSDQGFTLMEILIALIIAGILGAFMLPSLMGLVQGNELKSAQDQVQNALRDAQRQAIRRSKSCEIIFDVTANPPRIYTDGTEANKGCLTNTDQTLSKSVKMNVNLADNKIQYSFKGHTNKLGTIVVYSKGWNANNPTKSRCVVVSENLGITRSGVYTGNPTATISATSCQTSTSTL